jgi:hypothetical protein
MHPNRPCGFCGSTRFGVVDDLRLDIVCDAKLSGGNVLKFSPFSAVVCAQCGATHLFVKPGRSGLLEAVRYRVVDVPPATP